MIEMSAPLPSPPAQARRLSLDPGTVDAENPWPGLAAFREADHLFFFGRERETEALYRAVLRERLTVLFGRSGLGKTSLLQAGLFPRLRQESCLPVPIRLDFPEGVEAEGRSALVRQVRIAIARAAAAAEVEAPPLDRDETLWEMFHRQGADFWSLENRLVFPVLVFDQFEEIFTLGKRRAALAEARDEFLIELADLIEGRPPAGVKARLDASPEDARAYAFQQHSYKVVLSLREDFLPDLEGMRERIPSLGHNRIRLRRMNGEEALHVVTGAGGELAEEAVARRVVCFVAGEEAAAGVPETLLTEMEVEPALLSVVCRELNNVRRQQGEPRITADLLAGHRTEILSDFYERSLTDLGPEIRIFIEDCLITESGYRDTMALENALREPRITTTALDRLIDRRLLRKETRGEQQRIELTHDVLTGVIRASRDARRQREAQAAAESARCAAEEREREAHRKLRRSRGINAVLVLLLLTTVAGFALALQQTNSANQARTRADQERTKAVAAQYQAERNQRQAERARRQAKEAQRRAEDSKHSVEQAQQHTEEARKRAVEAQRQMARSKHRAEEAHLRGQDLIIYMLSDLKQNLMPLGKLGLLESAQNKISEYFNKLPEKGESDDSARLRSLAHDQLAEIDFARGRTGKALKHYRDGLAIAKRLAAGNPGEIMFQEDLAISWQQVGMILLVQGKSMEARDSFLRSMAIWQRLVRQVPENLDWKNSLMQIYASIGDTFSDLDPEQAKTWQEKSWKISEELLERETVDVNLAAGVCDVAQRILATRIAHGEPLEEIEEITARILDLRKALVEHDPKNQQFRSGLASTQGILAVVYLMKGASSEAVKHSTEALKVMQAIVDEHPDNMLYQLDLSLAHGSLGNILLDTGQAEPAADHHQKALDLAQQVSARDSANLNWKLQLADAYSGVGKSFLAQGNIPSALEAYRTALARYEDILQASPDHLTVRNNLSWTHVLAGQAYAANSEDTQAREQWSKAVEIVAPLTQRSNNSQIMDTHVRALLHLGRNEEAKPLVDELLRRGWNYSDFRDLARKSGLLPDSGQ